MSGLPSRQFQKHIQTHFDDTEEMEGIAKELTLARSIEAGMETPFGVALYAAIEDIERSCYAGMSTTSPWRIDKQQEYRAELRTVLYLKARLDSYVTNADALALNLQNLNGTWDNTDA